MKPGKRQRNDLTHAINETVVGHQQAKIGESIIFSTNGLHHRLRIDGTPLLIAGRYSRLLKAEFQWVENLLSHAPSIGTFYESILRSFIKELLPTKFHVSQGFVHDSERRTTSPQIDIVVYLADRFAPIYQCEGFKVFPPEATLALAEVKKTLTLAHVRDIARLYLPLYLGQAPDCAGGVQKLNIFAFQSSVKTEKIVEALVLEYRRYLINYQTSTVGGDAVSLGLEHIVLFNFFFLDRPEYIYTHLRFDSAGRARIKVTTCKTGDHTDGLHEFLASMSQAESVGKNALDPNLLHFPLHSVHGVKEVLVDFYLYQEMSAQQLADRFPDETDILRTPLRNGEVIIAATCNSELDWKKKKSLSELIQEPSFRWIAVPVKPITQSADENLEKRSRTMSR
jgi:hypothetical protein